MYIYSYDCGWRGCIVVVASDVFEAANMILSARGDVPRVEQIEAHPFVPGVIINNWGACD